MKTLPSLYYSLEVGALRALAVVSLFLAPAAQAAVMVSNLANTIVSYDQVEYRVSTGAGQRVEQECCRGSERVYGSLEAAWGVWLGTRQVVGVTGWRG